MSGVLEDLGERIKALGGDWGKYSVVGSFVLYVAGYLALRFHLTVIGIGTDLAVLDERYLFTGARFAVYLVAAVPSLLLMLLPFAVVAWGARRLLSPARRAAAAAWLLAPRRLVGFGIVFAVLAIQFVMRQCFDFSNLLLAPTPPREPAWLVRLLLDDTLMPLYFTGLVAACALPLAILWRLHDAPPRGTWLVVGRGLLVFLASVQVLLLPINYGVLIVDKSFARVAALGERALADGDEAWLVWEGKDGVTYLVRSPARKRRALLTLPRDAVKQTEIIGFDRILPLLFGAPREGAK